MPHCKQATVENQQGKVAATAIRQEVTQKCTAGRAASIDRWYLMLGACNTHGSRRGRPYLWLDRRRVNSKFSTSKSTRIFMRGSRYFTFHGIYGRVSCAECVGQGVRPTSKRVHTEAEPDLFRCNCCRSTLSLLDTCAWPNSPEKCSASYETACCSKCVACVTMPKLIIATER